MRLKTENWMRLARVCSTARHRLDERDRRLADYIWRRLCERSPRVEALVHASMLRRGRTFHAD